MTDCASNCRKVTGKLRSSNIAVRKITPSHQVYLELVVFLMGKSVTEYLLIGFPV